MKSKITIGILANVDAGKTTLTESILYRSGKLQTIGRVDNQDAFLDTEILEKQRGITIYSKPARFTLGNRDITLLDTPGHVDFSLEMERALSVLDYAILLVSGPDGVEGHTLTLWKLLKDYKVPVIIFVNKMDQNALDQDDRMDHLKKHLDDRCVNFSGKKDNQFFESLAMRNEATLEGYLESGTISDSEIRSLVYKRKLVPVFFGSALKMDGIDGLLEGLDALVDHKTYPETLGGRAYKISRDESGARLVHIKVTGGRIKVKDLIYHLETPEKVNQIRLYDGGKYETVSEVGPGEICTLVGIQSIKAGDGIGYDTHEIHSILEPVLSYKIKLPKEISPREALPKLMEVEDEHPELNILWVENLQEIHVNVMGDIQIEILKEIVLARYGFNIEFGEGNIVYKETIASKVEGVGHFEPLRHYAEVHLILSPNERGGGMVFDVDCDEAHLAKNWQNLVMTHLAEKTHKGVLIGADLTDVKITVVSGRGHNRHTEGGDFREATYRAVRQGLMEAQSLVLEPYYDFKLTLPQANVGKAMVDVGNMGGKCEIGSHHGDQTVLIGEAPVREMRYYHKEVMAYTKGYGRLDLSLKGYDLCHNADEVIEARGYDPELDFYNPVGSVFCEGGAGYYVPWDRVKELMHVEAVLKAPRDHKEKIFQEPSSNREMTLSLEEIDQILTQATFKNQGKKTAWQRSSKRERAYKESYSSISTPSKLRAPLEKFMLVDGYNIVFAWDDLKVLAEENHMESAKSKLLDIMSNYAAIKHINLMVVFDAYRVKGHREEVFDYHNIQVVYTKEAQTADQYIEKFSYDHQAQYDIIVATSDGLQQIIVRGAGSRLLSARDLLMEVSNAAEEIDEIKRVYSTNEKSQLEKAFNKALENRDDTKERK